MSEPTIVATSIGKTQPHSVTFEVADYFLESELGEWHEPVLFRFVQRDDGRYDLEMQRLAAQPRQGNPT